MLVLSRKENEKIHLGNNITITVVKLRGGTVRLGIEAPPEVNIARDEVRHKQEAASAPNV
jgi:carbon storage regulator